MSQKAVFGKKIDPQRSGGRRGFLPISGEEALHILGDEVSLDVDPAADLDRREGGVFQGVRDDRHAETVAVDLVNSQADAVDRHRSLFDQEAAMFRRETKAEAHGIAVAATLA